MLFRFDAKCHQLHVGEVSLFHLTSCSPYAGHAQLCPCHPPSAWGPVSALYKTVWGPKHVPGASWWQLGHFPPVDVYMCLGLQHVLGRSLILNALVSEIAGTWMVRFESGPRKCLHPVASIAIDGFV